MPPNKRDSKTRDPGESGRGRPDADELATRLEQAGEALEHSDDCGPAAGTRVGPYRLIRLLGRGGMGEVYLAEQLEPVQREVALKLLGKPGSNVDHGLTGAYFQIERQVLAGMQHPYIAQVFDAGTTEDGRLWFAMERVPGKTIIDYCDHHALDRRARIHLFGRVCQGVQHAHQRGIIHRDLKPANILVSRIDDRDLPKIIDFGIATSVADDRMERKTRGGSNSSSLRAGTLAYMSPEQLTADGERLDTRADVYALGVLLFELVAGRRPPEAENLETLEMFHQRLGGTTRGYETSAPNPSNKLRQALAASQNLDRELRAILAKALAPQREDRYESAAALGRDLQRYLNGEVVEAHPPSKAYHLRKLIGRNRLAVAAGCAVTLALIAGLAIALWGLVQVQSERDRAQAAADRAQQTAGFVQNILGSINPGYAQGADTTLMRRVLDDAAERAGRELVNQPDIQADIAYTIGRSFRSIGEYSAARRHFVEAVDLSADNPVQLEIHIRARVGLADLALIRGDHEEALEKIDAISADFPALGDDRPDLNWELLLSRAHALHARGHLDTAEAEIRQALANTSPDQTDTVDRQQRLEFLEILAKVLSDSLQLDEAETVYGQIRAEAESWDQTDAKRYLISSLGGQAIIYLHQQRNAEAEILLREAIAFGEAFYGVDHPMNTAALSNLASSLRHQDRPSEALPYYRRVHGLSVEQFGDSSQQAITASYNLGNCLHDLGAFEEAIALQRDALERAQARFSENTFFIGMLNLGLGRTLVDAGDPGEAIELLEAANVLLTESAGADFYRTVEARDLIDRARALLGPDYS